MSKGGLSNASAAGRIERWSRSAGRGSTPNALPPTVQSSEVGAFLAHSGIVLGLGICMLALSAVSILSAGHTLGLGINVVIVASVHGYCPVAYL